MNKSVFLYVSIGLFISGCNQQNDDLNIDIARENLCIYTNEHHGYKTENFLVHFGLINFDKDYKAEYEKKYNNTVFPTEIKNCIYIPLNKIEKDKAYTITLSTINKTFTSRICILEKNNSFSIKQVKAGESTCD